MNKVFFLQNNFNCESRNLIHVIICRECQEEYIGETGCLVKERISVYRQHIRQSQYQQIKVEQHLRFCSGGEFQMFPFLQIKQENKLLTKAYEDYFIERFKPLLNQKVVSCITNCGFNLTPFALNLLPRQHQTLRT